MILVQHLEYDWVGVRIVILNLLVLFLAQHGVARYEVFKFLLGFR